VIRAKPKDRKSLFLAKAVSALVRGFILNDSGSGC
jgi:hypothetical protein